jgi:hypothetical protein
MNSMDSTGDDIWHSKACKHCFATEGSENCKYGFVLNKTKDSYDSNFTYPSGEESYEIVSLIESTKSLFSIAPISNSMYVKYIDTCVAVNQVFGCISLKKKSFCILNKQYSREEYEKMEVKIKEHMNSMPYIDARGRIYRYGDFFPSEISPFAYNESLAQEYFNLDKQSVLYQGWGWKDPEERNYKIQIPDDQLPDHIKDVKDDLINKIIECGHKGECNEQCTTAFKIIEPELQFYKKMNLPLPRLCPNCRHYQRLKQRNPLKLWHRKCMCAGKKLEIRNEKLETSHQYQNTIKHFHGDNSCPNEFETSYSPNRQEIIYCEQCYNAEVV